MTPKTGHTLVKRFGHLKTLVVGDLMLDHYIWGSVSRISPEAPVPVVEVTRETDMPGGAGNVATNMAALGAQVFVIGLVGQDATAERLLTHFKQIPIHAEHVIRTSERPTTVKIRVIAHHQQVVRVDRELKMDLSADLRRQLWEQTEMLLPHVDAVVLSDYGKGVIHPALVHALIPLARRRGIPITVDPKVENFRYYQHVTCVTPNLQEALEGCGVRQARTDEEVERLGHQILRQLASDAVLITRGEKGMTLLVKKKPVVHIPTRAREVYDVTGAGDTVISALTMALAAGSSLRDAAELANYAAGVVVGKIGTSTASIQDIETAMRNNCG